MSLSTRTPRSRSHHQISPILLTSARLTPSQSRFMSSRNTVLRGSGGEEYVHHWWSMFDSEHLLQPERTRFRPYNTSAVLSHVLDLFVSVRARLDDQPPLLANRNGARGKISGGIERAIRCGTVAAQAS